MIELANPLILLTRFLTEVRKIGGICFLFFSFLSASGQSFHLYRYQTTGSDSASYWALLTVYPEGNATARVRFTNFSGTEEPIFEVNLTDSSFSDSANTEVNLKTRTLIARESYDIMGYTPVMTHVPSFQFVRIKENKNIYYQPGPLYFQNGNKWEPAIALESKTLSYVQLSDSLVKSFYSETDPLYKTLFRQNNGGLISRGGLTQTEKKSKLFLIIVANTLDSTVANLAKQGFINISATFTDLGNRMGLKVIPTNIWGKGYSKKAVTDAVTNLRPGKKDIVVFYYIGHGYRRPGDSSRFPRLVLSNNWTLETVDNHSLPVESVYNTLVKKGAWVTLVISDCCNEKVESHPPDMRDPLGGKSIGYPLSIANCRNLFFPPKPTSILATGADVLQLARGTPNFGGFFSWQFKSALEMNTSQMKTNVSWMNILTEVRQKTYEQTFSFRCGNTGTGRCLQEPWFDFGKIEKIPPP